MSNAINAFGGGASFAAFLAGRAGRFATPVGIVAASLSAGQCARDVFF